MAYDVLASIAPINPQAFGPVMQQGQMPAPQGGGPQGGDIMSQYLLDKVAEIRGGIGRGALGGVMASMAQPQRVPPQ
jgi:hypothetical protein